MTIHELIDRRFRLVAQAGEGCFGKVFRAWDVTTGLDVAIKILDRDTTNFRRFEREAEVLATIRHPHVVTYVAHGLTEEGSPYLAMEWLEGTDLTALLVARTMSPREALVVALGCAKGLAAAHALGIIHRDVKPSNIRLVRDDPTDARMIDFGVARAPRSRLTATGSILGTPEYMAPEQARGTQDLSPSADVFSIGCVLFECLTGAPPFRAIDAKTTMLRLLTEDAPRLNLRCPHAPTDLVALLTRTLARDPTDRFVNAGALVTTIEDFLAGGAPSLPTH